MKRSVLKIILLAFSTLFMATPAGATEGDDICFFVGSTSPDNNPIEKPSKGNRTQPLHLECVITHDSVTVPGYDTADILAYEVYTEDGGMVASFVDELDFIDFIFSATGVYEIRLRFEDVTLAGFLSL